MNENIKINKCFRVDNSFGYPLVWAKEFHFAKAIMELLNKADKSMVAPYKITEGFDTPAVNIMRSMMVENTREIKEYMIDKIDEFMMAQSEEYLAKKTATEIFNEAVNGTT